MKTAWVDANVLLRFLTKNPPDLARRAHALMRRAEAKELVLRLSTVVVAEVVWVLTSYYEMDKRSVADALKGLVTAEGIEAVEADVVLEALDEMASRNVDFIDAYLAAVARARGEQICSFDADFKKLGVALLAP